MRNYLSSTLAALSMAGLLSASGLAYAQSTPWPQQPLRWIVGFAPGGTADVLTRIAAGQLAEKLGQSVVVENRPGASGAIALQQVAQSAPKDIMLITVPGPIIYPRSEPEVGEELAPIMLMGQGPMVIVGPVKNKENTLKEVLASAAAQPNAWSYATSGTGTSQHLAGELLNHLAKTELVQVPYKGGGQAVSDVVGAQVPLAILGPTPVLPHIRAHTLKAYAVTTTYRLDSLPDVPTVQEAGIPGYDASQWFAAATVKGVAPDHIAKINALLGEIVQTSAFKDALDAAGMIAGKGSPSDLQDFLDQDHKKWADLIKATGLSVGH